MFSSRHGVSIGRYRGTAAQVESAQIDDREALALEQKFPALDLGANRTPTDTIRRKWSHALMMLSPPSLPLPASIQPFAVTRYPGVRA
jgi:hypothetical protein